ncbi:MAG TPA: methyltransferase domain-containing protein [Xanthobacteraceae bacterium]
MLEPVSSKKPRLRLNDEVRFLSSWLQDPLRMGAISPSGPELARAIAAEVDLSIPGPIVELGPGTGALTTALLARGIAPERLVLVEYNPQFCELLKKRWPGINVVRGDAYRLRQTLADVVPGTFAAVVSGLPLLTRPLIARVRLLETAFRLLSPGAPFIQFSYGPVAPIPPRPGRYAIGSSPRIWRNFPPARVWVYRSAR